MGDEPSAYVSHHQQKQTGQCIHRTPNPGKDGDDRDTDWTHDAPSGGRGNVAKLPCAVKPTANRWSEAPGELETSAPPADEEPAEFSLPGRLPCRASAGVPRHPRSLPRREGIRRRIPTCRPLGVPNATIKDSSLT